MALSKGITIDLFKPTVSVSSVTIGLVSGFFLFVCLFVFVFSFVDMVSVIHVRQPKSVCVCVCLVFCM